MILLPGDKFNKNCTISLEIASQRSQYRVGQLRFRMGARRNQIEFAFIASEANQSHIPGTNLLKNTLYGQLKSTVL